MFHPKVRLEWATKRLNRGILFHISHTFLSAQDQKETFGNTKKRYEDNLGGKRAEEKWRGKVKATLGAKSSSLRTIVDTRAHTQLLGGSKRCRNVCVLGVKCLCWLIYELKVLTVTVKAALNSPPREGAKVTVQNTPLIISTDIRASRWPLKSCPKIHIRTKIPRNIRAIGYYGHLRPVPRWPL